MPVPVMIPRATISLGEGTLLKWFKAEGDLVSQGEVLFEMETDKAVTEVPSPADGMLLRILTSGGLVKVEEVVGWIGWPGETVDPNYLKPKESKTAVQSPAGSQSASSQPVAGPKIMATPAARRRAAELGVGLASVAGTGPGGRVTQEDVERTSLSLREASQEPSSASDRTALIQNLTHTWQTVPHIHISRRLDAGGLAHARKHLASKMGTSITDLILYALSRLLPRFPELTQVWNEQHLQAASQMSLAFAVDTSRGVVAPVIAGADKLSLDALAQKREALTEAARGFRLKLPEVQGGVFTLTNLGMEGVDFFAPILNTPQTAILAVGRMAQEPVVVDGSLGIGWRMWTNLTLDHRAADGAYAARFLEALQQEFNALSGSVVS